MHKPHKRIDGDYIQIYIYRCQRVQPIRRLQVLYTFFVCLNWKDLNWWKVLFLFKRNIGTIVDPSPH